MIFPSWLDDESERFAALCRRDQLPHALLIYGPYGVGRRLLAFRLAGLLLDNRIGLPDPAQLEGDRVADEVAQAHPDLRVLQLEENEKKSARKYKKNISVEQVRGLIGFLSMTSHQGGAKVALITPAHAMNRNTANCLLKTLEEPAENNFLILIAESLAGMPPTIVSRCHRIRIPLPSRHDSLKWLNHFKPETDWQDALNLSGGSPLAALELQRNDFPQIAAKPERDVLALQQNRATPAEVAKRWAKYDQEPCLRWLYNRIGTEIRNRSGGQDAQFNEKPQNSHLQKPGETLNIGPAFTVLWQVGELRRLQGAGLNTELHLADVLTWWYGTG